MLFEVADKRSPGDRETSPQGPVRIDRCLSELLEQLGLNDPIAPPRAELPNAAAVVSDDAAADRQVAVGAA